MFIGIPTWFVLLAAFNEDLTGIPFLAGFVLASLLTLFVVVAVDLAKRTPGEKRGLGTFGIVTIVWVAAYALLAIIVSRGEASVATVLVPFLGATLIAGFVGFARYAVKAGRRPPSPPPPRHR